MFIGIVVASIVGAGVLGYQLTQRHFFVGESDGRVAIFQGVQQRHRPDSALPRFRNDHDRPRATCRLISEQAVEATINADDLADAQRIVDQLSDDRLP